MYFLMVFFLSVETELRYGLWWKYLHSVDFCLSSTRWRMCDVYAWSIYALEMAVGEWARADLVSYWKGFLNILFLADYEKRLWSTMTRLPTAINYVSVKINNNNIKKRNVFKFNEKHLSDFVNSSVALLQHSSRKQKQSANKRENFAKKAYITRCRADGWPTFCICN